MKKFLLGTVGLVALGMAAPAFAADLRAKAAPPPVTSPRSTTGLDSISAPMAVGVEPQLLGHCPAGGCDDC